jgi:hypothetical protein
MCTAVIIYGLDLAVPFLSAANGGVDTFKGKAGRGRVVPLFVINSKPAVDNAIAS